MTKIFTQLSCFLLMMLCSCQTRTKPEAPVPIRDLTLVEHREELGDYGVIGGMVWGMTWSDGLLYVADHDNSRILTLDASLNAKSVIGRAGEGPGELRFAGLPSFANDRLSVYSPGSKMLVHYDATGTYLRQTSLAQRSPLSRLATFEELVFVSWPKEDHSISAVDMDGRTLFEFGDLKYTENYREKRARNHKHLAMLHRSDQPVLVALGETEPIIEIFDMNGALLLNKDLSRNPFLQKRLEETQEAYRENPANKEKSYLLFRDISVVGQHVYALAISNNPPFQILVFEVGLKDVLFKEVWQIHDSVAIDSFAYDGGEGLYIYDSRSNQLGLYNFYNP